jgi:hypothetical protein
MVKKTASITAMSLFLAGASGFLVSTAIGQDAPAPTRTVVVTIKDGATGPAGPEGPIGPAGPTGESGAVTCPTGFEVGELVLNHPGGQVTLYGCLKGN